MTRAGAMDTSARRTAMYASAERRTGRMAMAEFMCHNVSNGTVNCAFCAAAELCRMGHPGWLDWLQQEAPDG